MSTMGRSKVWPLLGCLVCLAPAPSFAAESVALGLVGEEGGGAKALSGVRRGAHDGGIKAHADDEVLEKAGAPLSALAVACRGRAACYDGIAKSLGMEIWLVEVQRETYVTRIILHRGQLTGSGRSAQISIFADSEIEAAAYGLAFAFAEGKGKGKLSVESKPDEVQVRVDGQLLGSTPLEDLEVDAGSRRVDFELTGFATDSHLVLVRPGSKVEVHGKLEPKINEIPLAGLEGPGPAPTPSNEPVTQPEAVAKLSESSAYLAPQQAELAGTGSASEAANAGAQRAVSGASVSRGKVSLPTWLALGLGAVAVSGGGVLGFGANANARSAREAPVQVDAAAFNNSAHSKALSANVLFGVGAAALGTATYLLIRDL